PVPGPGDLQGLGEQIVQLDHLDAPVSHLGHEVGVVALGILHPHHVVEEQFVVIGRGQSAVGKSRGTYEYLAQLAHFRMHAITGGETVTHRQYLSSSVYRWRTAHSPVMPVTGNIPVTPVTGHIPVTPVTAHSPVMPVIE